MEYVVCIAVFVLALALLRLIAKRTGIPLKWLWTGWFIKLFFTVGFVYIFSTYYGEGDRIQGDALNFLVDSKIIRDYAEKEPLGYLRVLSGIDGDDAVLFKTHLSSTQIWSYGENGDLINDNRLIIRINSVLHFFSSGNVYTHILFFSFFAYLGLILIYRAFEQYIPDKRFFFFTLIALPSIGFWGSGLTKEALVLLAIGLFLYSYMQLIKKEKPISSVALFLLSLFLLFANKPHVGLVLVPISLVLILGARFGWKSKLLYLWTVLILVTAILLSYTPDRYNLVEKISYKQRDMINVCKGGVFFVTDSSFCAFDYSHFDHFDTLNHKIRVTQKTSGEYKLFGENEFHPFEIHPSENQYEIYHILVPSNSFIEVTPIAYSGWRMIASIPEALVNTLIRPFPTDPGSPFKLVNFAENMWMIAFAGWVIFKRRKILSGKEKYIVYTLCITALIILLVIGWTTPVFGAIVRYKVPAELFLVTALFILYQPQSKSA
jgi:hypothetical protein